MKIQDLINEIDMSRLSSDWTEFEEFAQQFGFNLYSMDWQDDFLEIFESRVKSAPVYTWICTDTEVGIIGYFFDGNLICLSFQSARREDKNFYWTSQEAAVSVAQFIESLLDKEKRCSISLLSEFNDKWWDWDRIEKEIASR